MSKEPHEIFLDANIWFSSLYGSANCERLIDAHIKGRLKAVISRQVLEEILRNLEEKLPDGIPVFSKIVKEKPPIVLKDPDKITSVVKILVHQKDQLIFQSALSAKVKIFVTGNTKDFNIQRIKKTYGIQVLSPKQAVEFLGLKGR